MSPLSVEESANRLDRVAPGIVMALCLSTMILFVVSPVDGNPTGDGIDLRPLLRACLALTIVAILAWGVHCFTGDPYLRRTRQIGFAYFVMAASFLMFALPLAVKNQAIGTEPIGILSGCVNDGGDKLLSCKPDAVHPANFQWVLNVGGTVAMPGETIGPPCASAANPEFCASARRQVRAAITGGMVLPLPYLFIALVGGAISMSRRIPEIQKRSEPHYVANEADPKLLPCEVRERLTFQILQFVSAPLLAIVAYQVVHPDSDSTAAALAFMSGFGSESVLLAIRGAFDGVKQKSAPAAVPKATLQGHVLRAGAPLAAATVALVDGTRSTLSGTDGSWSLADVPVGAGQIVAQADGMRRTAAFDLGAGGVSCDIALDDEILPHQSTRPMAMDDGHILEVQLKQGEPA